MHKLRTPLWEADKTRNVYARAVRNALTMSQPEMARLLGISASQVCHMETGRREIPDYMLMAYQWVEHVNQPSIKRLAMVRAYKVA